MRLRKVNQGQDLKKVQRLVKQYREYKAGFAENIVFNPKLGSLSKYTIIVDKTIFVISPADTEDFPPLQLVQIYLDTATYDTIERDVKMTLTAQIGLVGGTMGLLTGFSILSAVEILYFATKLLLSMRKPYI